MKIALGCDPAGFSVKAALLQRLREAGHDVIDAGCHSVEPADYPVYARIAAEAVTSGRCDRGILVCGTGQGMAMSANRIRGIRAALCHDEFAAVMSREHNDANVLCMGAWFVTAERAARIVDVWLFARFSGAEAHRSRITMIEPDQDDQSSSVLGDQSR